MNTKYSFELLYKQFHAPLLNYAIYMTHSREDALEIVNDVFMAIWTKKDQLEFNASLKSYLYTSVKNKSINFYSKKRLKTTSIYPELTISSLSADHSILEKEKSKQLENILQSLPPKCRQVFMMSRMDDLSYKEIAELLSISKKTVEAQISKALKIFREKILLE